MMMLIPAASLSIEPARGTLLIAARDLLDPNFAKTVVLLLQYNDDGAVGVIVNRRSQIRPAEILPDIDALEDYSGHVYFGGPVSLGNLVVLLRTENTAGVAEQIVDGVAAVTQFKSLNEIVARFPVEAKLRLYAGYAGWAPGQLRRELARDDWHVTWARSEDVFSDTPEQLWENLIPPPQPLQAKAGAQSEPVADSLRYRRFFTEVRLRARAYP